MKRRAFLQQAGFALTSLGLSEVALQRLGDRYHQVLASPTPRKLALLVGINQYPQISPLNGCLTDVELQRELLQYRFGFQSADILTLTDHQATRQNLETAFLSHLIEQAQPNDVVVFHFSGYGSYLELGGDPSTAQTSLVPVDSVIPGNELEANDLLEDTLLLLLRSLPTDRVTTILDTSYLVSQPSSMLQGNLRLRAKLTPAQAQPSAAALNFQAQLLNQINASKDQARVARQSGQMPGMVLAAAGDRAKASKAFEARWSGFSTGVFTYTLTQRLWNSTPATIQVSFSQTASLVQQGVGKEEKPVLSGQKSREQALLPYYLLPAPRLGAAGVITAVEEGGKTGQLWLGGLPVNILEHYSVNALLTLLPVSSATGEPGDTILQLLARNGLEVKVLSQSEMGLQVGQYVREWVRVLPRQVGLIVALDAGLERIERVDATSAFAGLSTVKAVAAGEQSADCLFGKVGNFAGKGGMAPATSAGEAGEGRYALFSPGRDFLPGTLGKGGEAVKVAVQRLNQQFRTLLAAKLLRLTPNQEASRLAVQATLERISPQEQGLMQLTTFQAAQLNLAGIDQPARTGEIPALGVGNRIRYRLQNQSDRPLYCILLGLDTGGSLIAFYGGQTQPEDPTPVTQLVIAPGETLILPQPGAAFEWIVREPAGLVETHLIFSLAPFTQTLASLDAGIRPAGSNARIAVPTNPLEVAQAVLQDLHAASAGLAPIPATTPDQVALHVGAWAGLSFLYQVV